MESNHEFYLLVLAQFPAVALEQLAPVLCSMSVQPNQTNLVKSKSDYLVNISSGCDLAGFKSNYFSEIIG